jgi:16S rRNA (cytidine1402-2'-O)-methyltransferase
MSQKSYDHSPSLYLVPTPIGNLDDITLRAIKILKEVEVIFSEDTRETHNLLNMLSIKKPLIAAHEHNEDSIKHKMLKYLEDGYSIALVTDRGTPVVSDPGFKMVFYIIEKGYNVIPLPGATALIPALISSGISSQPFLFYGFLNSKLSKKKEELTALKKLPYTIIFYEAPHRIKKSLVLFNEILGNRQISIAREISKTFEEIYRGSIKDIIDEIDNPRGEFVIVVEGNKEQAVNNNITPIENINMYIKEGYSDKEAIKKVAKERGIDKNELYKKYHVGK